MLRSIRSQILVVSLVSMAPVALTGAMTYRALTSQREASREVAVTNGTLKRLGKIDGDLSRMQATIGTYVLFDDPTGVLALDGVYASARNELAMVRLGHDDPAQVRRVQAIERALDDWRREQGQPLGALAQTGQRSMAVRLAGASWLILQGLRDQQEQSVAAEHFRLAQRMAVHGAAQRRTVLVLLLGGVAAIAVAAGAAVVLGGHITRPLRSLTRSARAVAAGDMRARLDLTARDELGALASAFNTMVARVTERQEALQRAREEAESLLAIARVVGGTESLQEALRLVCRELARLTGADTVAAFVLDPPGRELRPLAAYRVPKEALPALRGLRVPLAEQGFGDEVVVHGRPVWSDDVAGDPRFALPAFREFTHQSSLMLPLVLDDGARPSVTGPDPAVPRVSGAFYLVWWQRRRRFTEVDLATLQAVGQQVGILLHNARLYAETQQSLAGAGLLNEAARTLHRTLDVRRQLPLALADLGRTFGAVGVSVTTLDGTGSEAGSLIAWGEAANAGVGSVADLFREREEPLLVADSETLGAVVPGVKLSSEVRGLAAFPVRGRRRVRGALIVLFGAHRELSPVEQRLLAAYADQLAMALDNAALFEETETHKTLLEHIFASTSDGILFLDRRGQIAALNRAGEKLLGIPAGQGVGQPLERLLFTLGERLRWMGPPGRGLLDVIADSDTVAAGDVEVREPSPRILRWQASPTRDAQGAVMGVTLTLREVTREREIDRMKTEFVSTVSHELRTPLTSIKGSLHLLLHDEPGVLEPSRRDLLGICLSNTDRLIRLINDILDVARIEAGQIRLVLAPRRVDEFVSPAADGIRALAASRGVNVVIRLDADLPEVRVDVDRMVQVMTNLLSNAIKFSPPGSEVRVQATAPEGRVEIRVIDQGRGLDASEIPRLFQKFQQLDGRTVREVGGSGLGLAICRGILNEHGGDIRVESTLGHGATFVVTLWPATRPPEGGAAPPPPPRDLAVDDEPRAWMAR